MENVFIGAHLGGCSSGVCPWPNLFIVYINDLADNVLSKVTLFADDTSIFQAVSDMNASWQTLGKDRKTIQHWAFLWKMSFNPDPVKQAKEVIFSSNRITASHPQLAFNDHQINVEKSHLGFTLYEKLTFSEHVREAMVKAKHGIGIIHFLETNASRDVLDQMYVQTLC